MKDISKKLAVINTGTRIPEGTTTLITQQYIGGGGVGMPTGAYLPQSVWNECFEIKVDDYGTQYLYGKLPMILKYGLSIYGEDQGAKVPSIAQGLPFDNKTIWYNPSTNQIEVIGGTGGGGEGGVSNFWDLSGIPSWITITKPKYTYSEIEGTPDMSKYALGTELAKYVTLDTEQQLKGKKDFKNGLSIDGLELRKSQDDVIYIDANLVVRGGVTMYAGNSIDIPSIASGLPFDNKTIWYNPDTNQIEVIGGTGGGSGEGGVSNFWDLSGIPSWITNSKPKYTYSEIEGTPDLRGYATESWVNTRIDSLINGAPAAYDTLKEIADVLQGNVNSIGDIITALGTKWTQDNTKIANWDTAYSWGNHANAGYALKSYVDSTFVTLGTTQTITGEKNFTGGIKVNGSPIYYDSTNKYWKLEGDLLVTGGVTMYGSDSEFTPSTIMDAIQTDGVTIRVNPTTKNLEVIGNTSGATTLGGLSNVGTWADSVADVDRIMYQAAGSSNWVSKNLSDLELKGDYLPLSGGTLTGSIRLNNSYLFGSVAHNTLPDKNGYLTVYHINNATILGAFGDGTTPNIVTYIRSTGDNLYHRQGKTNAYKDYRIWDEGNLTKLSQLTDDVVSGNYLPISTYTASDILSKLLTVDGSGSGLDSDTLDGYHANVNANANTVALRDESGALSAYGFKSKHYQKEINAVGWYRIYTGDNSSKGVNQVFLQIGRTYSKNSGESYSYSISVASQKVSVTRLSGTFNAHLITKIRIAKDTSQGVWYIDYYRTSATSNPDCISGVGSGTFQTPTLVEEVPLYSCEFDTGYGCKSETYQISDTGNTYQVGFIGNLNGNALSATKLATARTIWGQSFDGSANISGDLAVGNGDIYLSNGRNIRAYPTSGDSLESVCLTTGNNLMLGRGLAQAGYDTYLNGNNLVFRYGTAPTEGMRLTSTGNVLIGTTTDSGYKLDVNGSTRIDGIPISKSQDDVLYIDGNLVVRGGITMYGTNTTSVPSILDSLPIASTTTKGIASFDSNFFSVGSDGKVTFIGQTGGGVADSVAWANVTGKPTTLSGYGITDAKISNGVITLGGSTITPLTSHQTIYNLTLQAGSFSAVTFDPNGAAKTVNIPTTTSHISEGTNLYYTDARAQAAITGGASTIKTTNLTKSRALISNSSGKVAVSAVTSTELGYLDGVTSAIQTQLNGKLSLAGGELTGALSINTSVENSGLSISYNGTPMGSLCTNGSTFEMFNAEGYGITTLGTNLYALAGWNRYTLWHSGNDGSGSGLDADLLDGVQSGAFHQEFRGAIQSADINTYTTRDGGNYVVNFSGYSGMLVHFPCNYMGSVSALDLYVPHYDLKYYGLKARLSVDTSRYTDWREFAFTDSNVASATKLQTARTIWGQSFDGTGNVSGDFVAHSVKIYDENVIETIGNWNLHLNYYATSDISLCRGGGKVGIGTTSPSQKLDVVGDVRITSNDRYALEINSTIDNAIITFKGTDGTEKGQFGRGNGLFGFNYEAYRNNSEGITSFGIDDNANFFLGTGGNPGVANSKMVVLANGNVGIGTNNPELKLHVAGTMRSYYVNTDNVTLTENGNGLYRVAFIGLNSTYGLYVEAGTDADTYMGNLLPMCFAWRGAVKGMELHSGGNLRVYGGITMYSDQRKKTILGNVELSLKDIANAPLIEHYYNSDINKTTHVGSIAQYWAGMNDWFCKLDSEGFYTMEIQNCALASAISIARELDRYESKTDKTIKQLKKRICQLEEEVERLRAS